MIDEKTVVSNDNGYKWTLMEERTICGYRQQDGCYNCRFSIKWSDYEAYDKYICHKDLSDRPSPLYGFVNGTEEKNGSEKAWYGWKAGREVHYHGICDNWEPEA